jgi:ribonucleotide reductase alpha subunit
VQPRLGQPRPWSSARRVRRTAFDFERLGEVVRLAVRFLDRVVDINYYPTDAAGNSNAKWRPVGLGLMGLQDVFFKLKPALRLARGARSRRASPRRSTSTR